MKAVLENSLAGYCLAEKYHEQRIKQVIEEFMTSLRDRNLPLLELQEVIASISGNFIFGVRLIVIYLNRTQFSRSYTTIG